MQIASPSLYRILFERSFDSIIITNSRFEIIQANPIAQSLFELPENDLKKVYISSLFKDPATWKSIDNFLEEGKVIEGVERDLQSSSQAVIPCLLSVISLQKIDDTQASFLFIIQNATKRKKAERQIIRSEKLIMTGKLSRMIAHEIRNPLTNLKLALGQLGEEVDVENEAQLYFDIFDRNIDRIDKLISDLLDSSRPRELIFKETDIRKVLEDTYPLIQDRVTLNDMEFTFKFENNIPLIHADEAQLKIVFTNLFVNALEAMKDGHGKLLVNVGLADDQVEISVKDNGTGIPPDKLDDLFEPFYTKKANGVGLGLTTVQNIISGHKGQIEVESELGRGTEFVVSIPL